MKKRSEHLVTRYFLANPTADSIGVAVARYYSYQRLVKEKVNPYLNLTGLKMLNQVMEPACEVFTLDEQLSFLKLTRVLVKYFLEHQLNPIVLTSIRMKGESRRWHFEWRRKIS